MPERGQPETSLFIKFSVIYKVVQYMKRYNYSPYKAWMKLTKHRAFKDLMMDHYKNRKSRIYLVNRICNEYETKKNFYKNHVKKLLYSKLGKASLKERGLKL
jgi:hypothetical protein